MVTTRKVTGYGANITLIYHKLKRTLTKTHILVWKRY